VNTHGIRSDTPLHIAVSNCSSQNTNVVNALIENGANVDAINDQNETALHIATGLNQINLVETLLAKATKIDLISKSDETPLKNVFKMFQREKLEILKKLILAGCDIRALNRGYQSSNQYTLMLSEVKSVSTSAMPPSLGSSSFAYIRRQSNDQSRSKSRLPFWNIFRLKAEEMPNADSLLDLAKLLLAAGYKPTIKEVKLFKKWSSSKTLDVKQTVDRLLNESCCEPSRLTSLARLKIRNYLKKPINNSIQALDIPLDLKQFLQFKFLD
jgi:hypothetical protein